MDEIKKKELFDRNNRIIEFVKRMIEDNCPSCVDLIGIAGSFCNGDFHEKSDLDLTIVINNPKGHVIDRLFIIDDVGFDVYTKTWEVFEKMSRYDSPYVTKLIDLDIVYATDEGLRKYHECQERLKESMTSDDDINKKVGKSFGRVLGLYDRLNTLSDNGSIYSVAFDIVKSLEFILFMVNHSYVKRGTKRIPEEVSELSIKPDGFMEIYNDIYSFSSPDELINKVNQLIRLVQGMLDKKGIYYEKEVIEEEVSNKDSITSDKLVGTYEEIFSNWMNKMIHSVNIDSQYLSFVTMAGSQTFYDDMFDSFDNIPHIDLVGKYNANDLNANLQSFKDALEKWKELYALYCVPVKHFDSLDSLEKEYNNKGISL